MDKKQRKTLLTYAIPIALFTIWFSLDPSLNLSRIIDVYGGQKDVRFLQQLRLPLADKGYVMSVMVIALTCFVARRFGGIVIRNWALATVGAFILMGNLTEFPTLVQMTLVWTYDSVWFQGVVLRYQMLLTWLIAFIISLVLTIVIAELRRKKTDSEEKH